eukprot:6201595-Pleurochrysis_carterae.AAC.3
MATAATSASAALSTSPPAASASAFLSLPAVLGPCECDQSEKRSKPASTRSETIISTHHCRLTIPRRTKPSGQSDMCASVWSRSAPCQVSSL